MVPNLRPKDRELKCTCVLIMPLTLKKKLKGHIALGLSVRACVRPSVTNLR